MFRKRGSRFRRRCVAAAVIAALCAGLALSICGCADRNYPYEPDSPAPAPHDGTFVSAHGTMTFNGDGKTVLLDFDDDLTQRLGLPSGARAAAYEFLSGDLPPHGRVPVRYDAAMAFRLTVGGDAGAGSVLIDVGKYEDGQFYSGTNCVTAERITFFVDLPSGGGREPVDFLKS